MSELILEKVYNVKNIDTRINSAADKICKQNKYVERDFVLIVLYGLVVGIEAEIVKSKKIK